MSDETQRRSERMIAALDTQGFRLTAPRQAVVDVLAEGHQHLSHAEILERAREKHPDISRATVYRTLELLTELGIVHPTFLGDANQRFVIPVGGHHHHLICNRCGDVTDVNECHFGNALSTVSQQTGFAVESHLIELYGLCANCQ
jgi:Fur family transcriptional regulator, ferric uptake regulator